MPEPLITGGQAMQITGNSSSAYSALTKNSAASPATGFAAAQADFARLADYDSRDNTIFQNLLKNPAVRDHVILNDNGSYTFVIGDVPLTEEQGAMRLLIEEQNTDYLAPGQLPPFSVAELSMFRQMTGYNLLQAIGGFTFVDDYGSPVPASEQEMVEAAWKMFHKAKSDQEWINPGSDITLDGLRAAGEMMRDGIGGNVPLYQHLLDLLDAFEARSSQNDGGLPLATEGA
jgi:hypothetical protein